MTTLVTTKDHAANKPHRYAALQVVPPTAGDAGMILSVLSLAPMVIWIALIARTLYRLGGEEESAV